MELNKFHIFEYGACPVSNSHAVAGGNSRVCSPRKYLSGSPCGKHGRFSFYVIDVSRVYGTSAFASSILNNEIDGGAERKSFNIFFSPGFADKHPFQFLAC